MPKPGKPGNRKVRILLVDDHPMLREGLAGLINVQPDMEVCAEAGDVAGALDAVREHGPDMAVVDISLGGASGISLIGEIRARSPDLPVLVFSMHKEPAYAERALGAGAMGYVTKGQPPETVIAAVRQVIYGKVFVSDDLAPAMLRCFTAGGRKKPSSLVDLLSGREFEVFQMMGQGMTTRAIAESLHVSIKTVNTHRENIKKKLGLDNAAELARAALRWTQAGERA
jgi:DNA-binding NarL/FixJ family response regulator